MNFNWFPKDLVRNFIHFERKKGLIALNFAPGFL